MTGSSRSPLPVDEALPALRDALAGAGGAVLVAPPGAGKTTRVPVDLLEQETFAGRLVILEPRRLAARGAARRLADELDEPLGHRVGLVTRDERVTSPAVRIEVVTDGVLLRRLQRDPSLPGTGALLFDEFHERRLESELALAFAVELRAGLRPDLQLLVTSATIDGAAVAGLLGDVPIVQAEGRTHAVEIVHAGDPPPGRTLEHVADATVRLLAEVTGDVLVFLPGVRELRQVQRRLRGRVGADVDVRLLHGGLTPGEQDAALAEPSPGRRRIVLTTDVAETSLTVPGIVGVVDAGLSREPRFDAATGMTGLVTVPASRGSADQRAGRAGRLGPGRAIRCWSAAAHARRPAHPTPAIATDDLTGAALEVAVWGADVEDLALLDRPDARAWARAREVLAWLGALDPSGRPTAHGRALARLPLHPRLAHVMLVGQERGLGSLATELAAVLADRDPLRSEAGVPHADLAARVAALRGERPPAGLMVRRGTLDRARREVRRLRRTAHPRHVDDTRDATAAAPVDGADLERVGELVALAWPDRVAVARTDRRGAYLLANGRGATLSEGDPLAGAATLAVAAVDRGSVDSRGRSEARIHLAAAVDRVTIEAVLADHLETDDEVAWVDGDVVAERRTTLGAVVVKRSPLAQPPPERLAAALLAGVAEVGTGLLGWRRDDRDLQARLQLLHRHLGEPWRDVSDAALIERRAEAIAPFLGGVRRRADLARVDVRSLLLAQAPPTAARDLDRLAPTHLTVPSGSRVRLRYDPDGDRPVLAVKLQELFGATRTPAVLDGAVPVLIHLLSPAGRPVQVTDDLPSFWATGYAQVRAELRGRYPKHPWPPDPTTATPTARTTRRR